METANSIKMNIDGTIRAKVLQYKSDGNTLTEKRETLTKYAEGIYYYLTHADYGGEYCNAVLEINGVFWKYHTAQGNIFCAGHFAHKQWNSELRTVVATFPDIIRKNAELGRYINNLQIEVMRRLGYDVADLQAAHDEYIRQREERDRQQAEEAERRERERREAEERHKAEVLADGKEKLLKHERITVEQIELIAESAGYKINIRTLGFMREKVTEAVLRADDMATVWGRKLTSRNIDGTAKVMHELYDRLKAQEKEDTKLPATPAETPQISAETAETVNVPAETEKAAERTYNSESARLLAVIKQHELGTAPILFAYNPDKHIASATFKSSSGGISVVNAKCDSNGYCYVYDSCITIEELAWKNMHTHSVIKPSQSPETPQTENVSPNLTNSFRRHKKPIGSPHRISK